MAEDSRGSAGRGGYLEALMDQEQREREAYSQPGNQHLARHEIADLYGLSPGPPTLD